MAALMRIGLFLLAIAAGLSVIAGDATALLGSIGLIGLALSWALQTPIESFTGWVLNAFRDYYRPGDRIEVGSHGTKVALRCSDFVGRKQQTNFRRLT